MDKLLGNTIIYFKVTLNLIFDMRDVVYQNSLADAIVCWAHSFVHPLKLGIRTFLNIVHVHYRTFLRQMEKKRKKIEIKEMVVV